MLHDDETQSVDNRLAFVIALQPGTLKSCVVGVSPAGDSFVKEALAGYILIHSSFVTDSAPSLD